MPGAQVLPDYRQELDRAAGLRDESLVREIGRGWFCSAQLQSFRAVPIVTREGDQIMPDNPAEAFAWQLRVWDRIADVYRREIDTRFGPVIEQVLKRADLRHGEAVLDLGTGTGAVAILAATQVGTTGRIKAVDISPEMLAKAGVRVQNLQLTNIDLAEGRAEAIPAADRSVDVVLASLSLMYVIDRATAAKEIARVLRRGGRFVAAVWGAPSETDIVKFQQTAGSFAPAPPVQGVGPGALADPSEFLSQLQAAGLDAKCEKVTTTFEFAKFQDAWDALAGVTAAALEPKHKKKRRPLCAS